MEAGTTSTTLTAKLPILNPGDYDLWLMRIEQYFLMTDYSLWEVIKNGNKVLKRTVGETKQEYEPTTAEEKQDKRNEIKARGTLLMALPNKDQLNQVIDKFKTGLGYNAASSTAASPTVERFVNSSEMLENQKYNKSKSDKGYHAVPPPFTGNFIPRKPNLTFMDEIVERKYGCYYVVTSSNVKTS
ncbi:hypothetical protein Tco_0828114 [Tanacetum coccineum]